MKPIICVLVILLLFSSCEKTPEYSGNGYFKGTVNGYTIITDGHNNKYVPYVHYDIYYFCPIAKGRLRLGFSSKIYGDDLLTTFLIDGIDEVDGKKYSSFIPENDISKNCDNIPGVTQWLSLSRGYEYLYDYIPHKDNYLKIEDVTQNHVAGHFKIRFIRKQFLEQGIESFDKHLLPDSMFVECQQFIAPIRD